MAFISLLFIILYSGNVKLSCQFAEIHEDSTISWTKDSTSIAQVQRRCVIRPGYFSQFISQCGSKGKE